MTLVPCGISTGDVGEEIAPIGIHAFDEVDLPGARQMFQRLFALDGGSDIRCRFEPHQLRYAIALGEAIDNAIAMLDTATEKIIVDTDLKRSARLVAHQI